MAIYHFSIKPVTRNNGDSAIGKAAYRAAENLYDERLDKAFNYSNKSDLFFKEIMSPDNNPNFLENREKLWNHVEECEKRKDARTAMEFEVALPKELSEEQNIKMVQEYVRAEFLSKGLISDVCFHKGHGRDQPHAHIMVVTRELKDGELGKKVERLYERSYLHQQRENWANIVNKHLAKAGFDLKVDHRSNKDRDINLEPQNKIGSSQEGARSRFKDKVLEHQEIARSNGESIYANPSIAIDALTKYRSTFTYQDLAIFLNTHTVDKKQFDLVYEKVKSAPEMIKLGKDDKGRDRYTSQEMIDLEYRMVRQAQSLSEISEHRVNLEHREELSKEYKLSESQVKALRHITGDRDMACVVGYAGGGKSYMLGAAREIWEKEGYNVVGMTLSGIAAENLEGDSGIKSYTVANRIINWNNDRERLKRNDIVVVDEAGMLGSRDIAVIMDEVVLADAKVVLIGDTQQLQAIEAGAAFRGVIERVGHVDLNEIIRQAQIWQKEATKSFALGNISEAMQSYMNKDMIHEFETSESAKEKMVNDWHETVLESKSSIMLSYTRDDVKDLNERAREVIKSYGELQAETSYQTKKGERFFGIGERIYFLENNKDLGVKNGTLATIIGLDNTRFAVELDKGGKITFDIRDYNSIDHGYAATIHKSQGVNVD